VSLILLSSLLVKLTAKEADLIIRDFTTWDPGPGGLSRVLAHDWSFDPRGSNLTLVLRLYHEQEQVLYQPLTGFREVLTASESEYACFLCHTCASRELVLPYFSASNHAGLDYEICCLCAEALDVDLSPEARAVCSSLHKPRFRDRVKRLLRSVRSSFQRVLG